MYLTRTFACLLVVLLAAGCTAQNTTAPLPAPMNPQLNRRIEVLVRSQFEVPPDVSVAIGTVSKSDFPGYENLPITFAGKGQPTTVNFLLSNDGNTIARMEKFDISHSPAEMITTEGRPVRGPANAKVTIVNFDDLECPYCAQMHAQLFPETADRYKNLVKFVYKDYPLVEIHPWAMHSAITATCLADQSGPAYWNYVDYVHSHASEISGTSHDPKQSFDTLDKVAREEGQRSNLDLTKLNGCMAKQDKSAVLASMKQGDALGVNGTPTIFINGERISGVLPAKLLWIAIDRALKSAGIQPPAVETNTGANKVESTQPAQPQGK
ncbi:MAG TPA: thioredoxin domain-containing protein [Acidobacteriaceae bacterium]